MKKSDTTGQKNPFSEVKDIFISQYSRLKKYFIIILGTMIVAFAVSVFYTPNKIVGGGVSGIATILYHTVGIAPGLSFALINTALLMIAAGVLGKMFVADTILGAALLSIFVQIFSYIPPITDDIFLASIFGAVFYGLGIGLVLTQGASTGGTDILGRLFQHIMPHVKIGTMLLVVDFFVIASSLIVFRQFRLALYGIIALYVSSFTINWLIRKLNISKLAFVVTDKGVELTKKLVSTSPRGVTLINAEGGYTMTDKQLLLCALKENEAQAFQKKILNVDPGAFIIFSESSQIVGNGFAIYK